jgi:chromosomal replication initiation ATPase DnaA
MDELQRAIWRARAVSLPVKPNGNHEPNIALIERVQILEALCEVFSQRLTALEHQQSQVVTPSAQTVESIEPRHALRPTIAAIQGLVCKAYSITQADMLSRRRTQRIVRPRHVAMYLCTQLTLRSPSYIGRLFGNIDRTTVINARERITGARSEEPELAKQLTEFERQLGGIT